MMLDVVPAHPFLTGLPQLAEFGPQCELVDKAQLTSAARAMVGRAVDQSFSRFAKWLLSEGYAFRGFDKEPLRLADRSAYLRYDVHGQDLMAAYILADLHEQLGIVGSFQITWRYSRQEEPYEPYFAKLLDFDRRFIEFGLHAAPAATWYLNEKLGGDPAATNKIDGEAFTAWVLDLRASFERDGHDAPGLQELRRGADDVLMSIATSFGQTFGELRSVSGHGNFLTSSFVDVRTKHPEVGVLQPYFFAGDYLHHWGVERFGFNHVAAAVGSDAVPFPRMMWEGGAAEIRRKWYRGRVEHGAGFVALLHPASWTWRHNATFFLSDEEAAALEDRSDA